MSKDKDWLKEEMGVDLDNLCWNEKLSSIDTKNVKDRLNCLVDQLDEPEPPVVPKFVAEYITVNRYRYTLGEVAEVIYNGGIAWSKLMEHERWIRLNFTLFAKAWITGNYTIEQPKELTAIVKDCNEKTMTKQMSEDEVNKMMEGLG